MIKIMMITEGANEEVEDEDERACKAKQPTNQQKNVNQCDVKFYILYYGYDVIVIVMYMYVCIYYFKRN